MDRIFLLIGESGSGKSSIEKKLCNDYGLKSICSYTTRPIRLNNPDDIYTHTFVSQQEYDQLKDKIAETHYSGYDYCATAGQVDESDIYVIDPDGVTTLEHRYKGKKKIEKIYIFCPMSERLNRLEQRDGFDAALQRIKTDIFAFRGIKDSCDLIVKNGEGELDKAVKTVWEYIKSCEKYGGDINE